MTPVRIAIAGLGSIGKALAATLDADGIPGLRLTAVSARDLDRARLAVADFRHPVAVVPLAELEPLADWVVECAPAALLPSIVTPFLAAGKPAIVLSVGALLAHPELIETARRHGSHLHVPTGALIGLDAVLAPLCVFAGTARQAVEGFPANANVAAALSLAGIGPERTRVEIWADPLVSRNTHQITVDADSARFTMTIENIASANPRTSRSAVQSLVALLRKMTATLKVGT